MARRTTAVPKKTPAQMEQDIANALALNSPYTPKQRAAQVEIQLDSIPGREWSRERVSKVLRAMDTPALRAMEHAHAIGAGIFGAGRQVAHWAREILTERGV